MEALSIEEELMPNPHTTAQDKNSTKPANQSNSGKTQEKEIDVVEELKEGDTESEFSVMETLREPR
jgi:hypothetical protein